MKINNLLLLLSFTLSWTACIQEPITVSESTYSCTNTIENTHPDSELYQAFIQAKVAEGFPGITMLIESPEGMWAGAAGYADIANKIPMEVCNISRVGSITKTFTATLILQLQEKGLLQLDDVISKYLPEQMVAKIANADKATIEQLLNHTSGLADFTDNIQYSLDIFNNTEKHWTAEDELAYIYDLPAKFEPGAKRLYTNINFVLLGVIVENITEKKGAALYKEQIFAPLGMNNTYFNQDNNRPTQIVRGYGNEENNQILIDRTEMTFAHTSMAGGIVSNVEDLKTYIQAVIKKDNGLLNSAFVDQLDKVSEVPGADKTKSTKDYLFKYNGVGLGWFNLQGNQSDRNAVGHGGSLRGYQAFIAYFPNTETTLCYLINGNDGMLDELEDEMRGNELMSLLFD